MQDFGRLSDGAGDSLADNATRQDLHKVPMVALRASVMVADNRHASAFGKLRDDLAAFRADQVKRLAAGGGATVDHRKRQGGTVANPRPGTAGRFEWREIPIALVPMQLLLELAISFGIAAGLIMFWRTFGPAIVAAIAGQPVQ